MEVEIYSIQAMFLTLVHSNQQLLNLHRILAKNFGLGGNFETSMVFVLTVFDKHTGLTVISLVIQFSNTTFIFMEQLFVMH